MKDIILDKYQIRKSDKEKTEFINYIKERLDEYGYNKEADITVEEKGKGLFRTRNIVVGKPETAEVFLTAHYDTCAVMPFPNLMAPTNPVIFIVYQILLVIMLFLLTGAVGYVAMLISNNALIAYYAFLISLFLLMFQLMFGYRNKHNANDNTSGVLVLTRLLEELPTEHRNKVCVVYFDNEEKGLIGSAHFAKKHKKDVRGKLLVNMDCVGDGENVVSMAKWKAREDKNYNLLVECFENKADRFDVKYLCRKMKPMMFPSDQANYSKSIGICALRRSPIGLYAARIHTPFDTKCRRENIEFLACAIKEYIEQI
ncbi:MAG: M28 family peptidase [Lachnospiraceae bacterium]|nr:M28 family peptidase [Lachnospiraceae bacterium]